MVLFSCSSLVHSELSESTLGRLLKSQERAATLRREANPDGDADSESPSADSTDELV